MIHLIADDTMITLTPTETQSTKNLKITNIYAPNSPTKKYFQTLTHWFLNSSTDPHIIGGDLNTTITDLQDRKQL